MAKSTNPFRWFDGSRGIYICHETMRLWWSRLGPMFAAEIRRKRVAHMRVYTHWRWHLDEIYVRINGEMHHLSGAPSITKAKRWNPLLPRPETGPPP